MYMVGKDVEVFISTEDPQNAVFTGGGEGYREIPALPTGATTYTDFTGSTLKLTELTSIDVTFEKEWQENDFFGVQAKEWIELRDSVAGTIEKKLTDGTFQKAAWEKAKGYPPMNSQDTVKTGYRIYLKQTDDPEKGITIWHTLTNVTLKKATPKPDPVNASTETIEFDAKWGFVEVGTGANVLPRVSPVTRL